MAQAPRSSRLAQDKTSSSSAPRPAATTSELMCRLVNSRDKVFEMQRGCRDGASHSHAFSSSECHC